MRVLLAVACANGVLVASAAWAAEEPSADVQPTATSAERSSPADASQPKDSATKDGQPDDRWRFRQHQGIWWYWLPTNAWVYWTGDKWVPYDEAGYAEFYRARRPQVTRVQSSRGYPNNETGYWGPVRYDRFGNRQYPYSSRRSGLQQLGPVPAMGGVRSLPGWGGER